MSTPESLEFDAEHERQVEAFERYDADWLDECHKPAADGDCVRYADHVLIVEKARADERRKARAEFNESWKTNLPLINARTRAESIREAVSRAEAVANETGSCPHLDAAIAAIKGEQA